jgi:hypothetical protein
MKKVLLVLAVVGGVFTIQSFDLADNHTQIVHEHDVEGGRCTARTKKGTQCSRSAEQGRTRCWQH